MSNRMPVVESIWDELRVHVGDRVLGSWFTYSEHSERQDWATIISIAKGYVTLQLDNGRIILASPAILKRRVV